MRSWVVTLGVLAAGWGSSAPITAQGMRAAAAAEDAPTVVTTRVRHVTAVVLPEAAEIVDVVTGDAAQWDVQVSAHLAFVRPLVEGARSNVVLLTAAGTIVPLLLVERDDATVDAIVRIGVGAAESGSGPVLAAAELVAETAVRAAVAWESVASAEARVAERIAAARSAAAAKLNADREAYSRQAQFEYRWPAAAADHPWHVEGMWHDGRRTYLRTRAVAPVLYERVNGELAPVAVADVRDDVLHVVPRVLGAGALDVGGRRLAWSVSPREAGP